MACVALAAPKVPTSALTSDPAGTGWPSVPRIAARVGTVRVTRMWSPVFRAGAMVCGDHAISALLPVVWTCMVMGSRQVPRPGTSMMTVAGTVMTLPDPMGVPVSTLMGDAAACAADVACAVAGPPIPRERSRLLYAWVTSADRDTVRAGRADRLPSAHVLRNPAAAAEAC